MTNTDNQPVPTVTHPAMRDSAWVERIDVDRNEPCAGCPLSLCCEHAFTSNIPYICMIEVI